MHTKTWSVSQRYELNHAIEWMMTNKYFHQLHADFCKGALQSSTGYVLEDILVSYFASNLNEWNAFRKHISGKFVMDIGANAFSPIVLWDEPFKKIVIDPLFDIIFDWQKENLGRTCLEGVDGHAIPAELLLSPYVGKIDGAIYCRNMLDHTPEWPFVLANIAKYAAPGCKLLLWSDLDHFGLEDEGHYSICTNKKHFKTLIEALGITILREFNYKERNTLNYGFFGVKL